MYKLNYYTEGERLRVKLFHIHLHPGVNDKRLMVEHAKRAVLQQYIGLDFDEGLSEDLYRKPSNFGNRTRGLSRSIPTTRCSRRPGRSNAYSVWPARRRPCWPNSV
jgi:hypothetical protein